MQASTCALTGYFPATFVVDSRAQSMEVCTTNPDAGEVCRTYTRAAPPPSGSPITCAASGPAFSEPRVGRAVAAGCWDTVSPGVYATTQTARIGGFTVSPAGAGARLVIDTGAKRVRATGPMRASIDGPAGALPDFDPADLPVARREDALPRAALPSLAGVPLGGGSRVEWTADGQGAQLKGGVSWANLPAALRDRVARRIGLGKLPKGDGSLTLKLDNRAGFSVGAVEAKLSDLAFPTPFLPLALKSVSARLEQPDPNAPALRWRLEGQLETPIGCARRPGEEVSCLEVRAIVYLTGDGPVGGGVGVDNLDVPIGGTPLKLQGLAGEIVFRPSPGVALSGNGTLGGRIRGEDRGELFNLSATLAFLSLATQGQDPCGTPVKLSGTASLPALEAAGGRAELGLKLCFTGFGRPIALTELGASLDVGLPADLASFRGTANGWYSPHAFSITGTTAVNIRRYPAAGGSFVLSDVAAAACAKVGWIEVGAVWRWHGLGQAWNSCDLSAFTPQRPRAAQAGPLAVRVPPGQRAFAIRVRGTGSAPAIRLTGPGGEAVDTAGPVPVVTDRLIADRDDARAVTTVVLRRPRPGVWRIASPQPVAGVATARAKPRLRLRARVRGTGARRRLSWRLTRRAGERVRFVDRTDGVARTIVSTRRHAGSVAFRPVRARSRRHAVVAVVVADGVPIKQLRLDRFAAARAAIRPPGQVRARRSGRAVRIRWRRSRATTLVSVRHGRLGGTAVVAPGRHAITRRGLRRGEAVRVTLRSVSADGRRSRPVTRRLR